MRVTFPESLAEILLLEIFCEEELINVEYSSTGTNCQNLFQSAVVAVNTLFQQHGIPSIYAGLWPNRLPPYFRTFFDIVNRKKNGKWSDGSKDGEKLLRQLKRRREELRVGWPSLPSHQQMAEDPGCRKRILSDLLGNQDSLAPTSAAAIGNDSPFKFPSSSSTVPPVHPKDSPASATPAITPPQAPHVPSAYPDSSDFLGGISGPSSTILEKSPQPSPGPLLEACDLFGEFISPSDLLRRPSDFDQPLYSDTDPLSVFFPLDPDRTSSIEDLLQASWDPSYPSSTSAVLDGHLRQPSVPVQHHPAPSPPIPYRVPTPAPCSIPIRKRKFEGSSSRSSTPADMGPRPLEPPRKRRKAHQTEIFEPTPLRGGFIPVQSSPAYHSVIDSSALPNSGLPNGRTPLAPQGLSNYDPSTSGSPWQNHVGLVGGNLLNPLPNHHRSQTPCFQGQNVFREPTYQPLTNYTLDTFPSYEQSLLLRQSDAYKVPPDVILLQSDHFGTATSHAHASTSTTSSLPDTALPHQPQMQDFIRHASPTAKALLAFPWCWKSPPWKKMREMAQSEAAWNLWVGAPPHNHVDPSPPVPPFEPS